MKNKSVEPRHYGPDCDDCTGPSPEDIMRFQRAIRAVTGKWKVEIISCLILGARRFGEVRRCLPGITQHMLTEQLRALENDGIVIRRAFPEVPPRVEYELSQAGIELVPTFMSLRDWAIKYEDFLAANADA